MSKVRIILQARTTSKRLPAKVLLTMGGLPMAILCGKRLGNRGTELVLATSSDPTDDVLAGVARDNDLSVFRGDLANVALRFLHCSADLTDEDIIVRATADNPSADGALVGNMLEDFRKAGADYLGPRFYSGTIPYGLCVEVFRLGAFRRVVQGKADPTSAEHVTTALLSSGPTSLLDSCFASETFEELRLTVDTLDDYLRAAQVFRSQADPLNAPWKALVEKFRELRGLGRESPE